MKHLALMLMLVLATAPLPLLAQTAETAPAATDADHAETQDLVKKAQFLKQQFEELLSSMLEVARLLDETEPDTARILRRTVEHAQRELVAEKMDAVRKALRDGLDQAAEASQGEVVGQLSRMLRILEGAELEKSETDKKIEERRAAMQEVERLLKDQQREERATRAAAHMDEIDRETQALLDALRTLAKRQEALMGETKSLPGDDETLQRLGKLRDAIDELLDKQQALNDRSEKADLGQLPVLGEVQKKLADAGAELGETLRQADQAGDLSKAISQAGGNARALDGAAKNVDSAGKEMLRAAGALGRSHKGDAHLPQRQAAADLRAARKAIDEAMAKVAAGSKTGEVASQQSELAGETGALDEKINAAAEKAAIDAASLGKAGKRGDLQKAAGHMNQAADDVIAQKKTPAADEQGKALAELRKKLAQVAELRERAMQQAQKKLDAARQQEIAASAKKLAESMKQGTDGKPMGGQESVAGAGQSADRAAGKMSQGQPDGANEDQHKAIKQLEQARQALEEEIAELEERSKAEKLARIEQRLERVLEQQKVITRQTEQTWTNRLPGEEPYDREAEQTLLDNARQEGKLAEQIATIRKMLTDEGTTIIFPEILGDVGRDLDDVSKRLAEKDPGPLTQTTQLEIERTLQELIDAVRKELSRGPGRRRGGGGMPGGGGGGKKPLIPPIAEIRMLRLKQQRILGETRKLEQAIQANDVEGDAASAKAKVLSREQQRVRKLTEAIKEKMTSANTPEGM